jgi:hypothetical protein
MTVDGQEIVVAGEPVVELSDRNRTVVVLRK